MRNRSRTLHLINFETGSLMLFAALTFSIAPHARAQSVFGPVRSASAPVGTAVGKTPAASTPSTGTATLPARPASAPARGASAARS